MKSLATIRRSVLFTLSFIIAACTTAADSSGTASKSTPSPAQVIQARIAAFEVSAPEKRPSEITRASYNGTPAWLVYWPCCDQFHYIYDAKGKALCAPLGGIAGSGDGKCRGTLTREGSGQNVLSAKPKGRK